MNPWLWKNGPAMGYLRFEHEMSEATRSKVAETLSVPLRLTTGTSMWNEK